MDSVPSLSWSIKKTFWPTRSQKELFDLLVQDTSLPYHKQVALAIEDMIAKLPEEQQSSARQQLPYMVQFFPIFAKYNLKLPEIRYVNRWIEYGGLTEYDKNNIHDKLPPSYFLKNLKLPEIAPITYDELIDLLDLKKFEFPLMHKPNKGERWAQMYYLPTMEALELHRKKVINGEIPRQSYSIQQYCDWPQEYCLQFYQHYDAKKRPIIEVGSLALREMPFVTGDGTNNVEELIRLLSWVSEQHKENIISKISQTQPQLLTKIPAIDEQVQIVFTASIDFGTKYRTIEQTHERKEQLEALLTNLLTSLPPSFLSVGRFDLKAKSLESLLAGEVKIIECNAGGGIPTHVYDESLTIPEKYEELFKHFDKMYEIIKQNKIPIASWVWTIISRPGFIRVSLKSFSKKWINLFDESNEKAKHVKRFYKQIFATLRTWRKERRKRRFENLWILSRRPTSAVKY